MVTKTRAGRRGGSALGCLIALLVVAVVLYYGLDLGRIYWNYYRLKDEMEQSARFAQGQSDDQIKRKLADIARDLRLPPEAGRITIRRSRTPPRIEIGSQYQVEFDLPFQHRVLMMRPHVDVRQ